MSGFSLPRTLPACDEAMPTDLLAELLMEDNDAATGQAPETDSLRAKVYAVMGATTLLTFGALRTGYELFFTHQLYG